VRRLNKHCFISVLFQLCGITTNFRRRQDGDISGISVERWAYWRPRLVVTGWTINPLPRQPSIFGCWPWGVELPATGGYVGTVSGDLPHSTQVHSTRFCLLTDTVFLHIIYSVGLPSSVFNTSATLTIHDW